jgi:hypothetical protein
MTAVVDFLLDYLSLEDLPEAWSVYVVCSDTCQVSSEVSANFVESTDVEKLIRGGKFLSRVSNDIQSGFLLSYLVNRLQAEVYSHRPEVISRLLGIQSVRLLSTPDKILENRSVFQVPASVPEYLQARPVDAYDKVYQESLEKYVETILCQQIRASKVKSARAQLKNIIDGIIISNNKKGGIQLEASSEEITDAIYSDLENHGIIAISMNNVSYFDEWIECYFGKKKVKAFMPRHRNPNGVDVRPQAARQPVDDQCEALVQEIISSYKERSRYMQVKSVGELSHMVRLALNEKIPDQSMSQAQKDVIGNKVMAGVIRAYFMTEDGRDLEEILKNLSFHFATKLIRKN